MQQNNICSLCIFQFLLLVLSKLRVIFGLLGAKIGYFEDWDQAQNVLGSTHIGQQLLFSLFSSILTFFFDLMFVFFFLLFEALMGYF